MCKTKPNSNVRNEDQSDGGFGWFIVLAAFIVGLITDGLCFSFGVVMVELLDAFDKDRASTALVGSVNIGVMYIVGPVVGYLSERYGCRAVAITGSVICFVGFLASVFVPSLPLLYVTYGFLGGLGFGILYLPSYVCIIQHFNKRRTLASGITTCGSSVGTFVWSHLLRFLLDYYGWRGTMLLLAGIAINGVACGLVFIPPDKKHGTPTEKEMTTDYIAKEHQLCKMNVTTQDDFIEEANDEITNLDNTYIFSTVDELPQSQNEQHTSDKYSHSSKPNTIKYICAEMFSVSLLRNAKYLAFLASTFLLSLAFLVPFNLTPDQAIGTGMSKYEASWLVSSIGITNTIGRLIIGLLGDRKCINRLVLFKVLLLLAGVATTLSPLLTSFETKMAYTSTFGFLIGGYVALIPVVLADMFGPEIIAKSFGLHQFAVGISAFASILIGGWIFDMTGSYDITFIVAGCEIIVAALVLILPDICFYIKKAKHSYTTKANYSCSGIAIFLPTNP